MTQPKAIGIIGVGFIGEIHVQAFRKLNEVVIKAVSDVNEARLGQIGSQYGIPTVYRDYREMLQQEKLDGIVIATPEQLHRKPVEAVAAAGLPLLLEKPIATTVEDAEAIINMVEKAGVSAMMAFCLRWWEPYVVLKERFDSGVLGTPHTAYARRSLNISEARRFQGRCSVNQYIGCHDLDFLLWIMGTDVESVFAARSHARAYQETGEADAYWNLIQWKNGAMASVLIDWTMPDAFPIVEDECLIIGTKGQGDKDRSNQVRFITDESVEVVNPRIDVDEMRDQAQGFVDLINGKVEPRATLVDGLRAQRLIWTADESIRTDQVVRVNL